MPLIPVTMGQLQIASRRWRRTPYLYSPSCTIDILGPDNNVSGMQCSIQLNVTNNVSQAWGSGVVVLALPLELTWYGLLAYARSKESVHIVLGCDTLLSAWKSTASSPVYPANSYPAHPYPTAGTPSPASSHPVYPAASSPVYPAASSPVYPAASSPVYPAASSPVYPANPYPTAGTPAKGYPTY